MRWVIGDIHGMFDPLRRLLGEISRNDPTPTLYFCGDYCDRGLQTRQVVDLLLELPDANLVRGNHDDVMDLCCNGTSLGIGPAMGGPADDETLVEVFHLFRFEGLAETMVSYGLVPGGWAHQDPDESVADTIRRLFQPVPERHKRFFRELPAVTEADDFFVCHATWPADQLDEPGRMNGMVAGDPYLRHDVLWGRYTGNQIKSKKVWSRPGYFGHTPTDNYLSLPGLLSAPGSIIQGEKVTLLDTAAFSPTGRLTAVCHETGQVLQAGSL